MNEVRNAHKIKNPDLMKFKRFAPQNYSNGFMGIQWQLTIFG